MSEDEQISRRGFMRRASGGLLVWMGASAAAGAAAGALADAPSEPSEPRDRKKPDIRDVMPPMLDTRTQVGRITAGATVGTAAGTVVYMLVKGKAQPIDTGREQHRIAEDFRKGRRHERWHADDGINPNEDQRNPPHR
ncbi:MAG: hypothetical protein AB7L92_01640 [Alphaproteobacteria bacterium]